MRTGKSIMWGIILLLVGVALGINSLGIFDFDIFFDGWWTLFIIIPSFINIFTDDNKVTSIVFLIIGVLLLLACQNIIDFNLIKKLLVPMIIVLVGLSLILKNAFNTKINKSIKEINTNTKASGEYNAVFSGQDIKIGNEEFNGTTVSAIFGGITLDLRNAIINKDIVVNCTAIFGGIDVYVPSNVKVQVKSNSIFGGVDNKSKSSEEGITIYINATCIFGGVDIK